MEPKSPTAVVAAFTEAEVERLTGISQRQLRYWASDEFYIPSLKVEDKGLPTMRLYSFRDLLCLKVISALRNGSKIPLQELRRTKERLAHLGDDLWAKTTLYILGKRVVFDKTRKLARKRKRQPGRVYFKFPSKLSLDKWRAPSAL